MALDFKALKWAPGETRLTKDVAKALGISTPKAYDLCCLEEKAGNLYRYGYRVRPGVWDSPESRSMRTTSLGWQYCPPGWTG